MISEALAVTSDELSPCDLYSKAFCYSSDLPTACIGVGVRQYPRDFAGGRPRPPRDSFDARFEDNNIIRLQADTTRVTTNQPYGSVPTRRFSSVYSSNTNARVSHKLITRTSHLPPSISVFSKIAEQGRFPKFFVFLFHSTYRTMRDKGVSQINGLYRNSVKSQSSKIASKAVAIYN